MNLKSLFRSSFLEIVLSRRIVMFLYALVGTLILFQAIHAWVQVVWSYVAFGEFDVPAWAFVLITIFLFLPYWLIGALIWRAVIRRMVLVRRAKKSYVNAKYTTTFTPAEMGVLVDGEYGISEAVATLLDMHFRGIIYLNVDESTLSLDRMDIDTKQLSSYEIYLLNHLFGSAANVTFKGVNDIRLLTIFHDAHEVLLTEMTNSGYLEDESKSSHIGKVLFRIMVIIAALVEINFIYTITMDVNLLINIMYPRYPLELYQVALTLLVALVIIGVVISGLIIRISNKQRDALSEAAGFYAYLRGVFRDRLAIENIHLQDFNTIRNLMAYMIAFKLVPANERTLIEVRNAEANASPMAK